MKELSEKMKARFCKDNNYQINIFRSPYFESRIDLYDQFYPNKKVSEKWSSFIDYILNNYKSEQDYYEEYNKVKDNAIDFIKTSSLYQQFNWEDMNEFACKNTGFKSKDIFNELNDGRSFLSIDLVKANFSALSFYDNRIFGEAKTWEEFIGKFTSVDHIIESKYIRQVILGNCNPKRHITFEKHIMDMILTDILKVIPPEKVVFFSNDEIVIDMTEDFRPTIIYNLKKVISVPIDYRMNLFKLYKLGKYGYAEKNFEGEITLKCVNVIHLPFIMRKIMHQEYQEYDSVFVHDSKLLSKLIEIPEIYIPDEL